MVDVTRLMTAAVPSPSSLVPATGVQPVLLNARELRQTFRIGSRSLEILRGVSLEVKVGESVFLVGASGAGKTTLLYTLAGLERPDRGTVTVDTVLGLVTYTPEAGFHGTDTVVYTVDARAGPPARAGRPPPPVADE